MLLELFYNRPSFFVNSLCVSLQSADADGAGGLGPLLPSEAEEQHSYHGISVSSQG